MANRFEVYAPTTGRHLVTYIHGLTFFDFQDIVGTERVKITQDGANSESTYSLPFGDGQSMWGNFANSGGPTHFDGKDRDTETGNDYFGARYFNSTSARWMRPDEPFVDQDPADPQSWNLYAFVRNNPVNDSDSTGLWCVWEDGTHDDPSYDGGASETDCGNSGGHWDPYNTITGILQDNGVVTQINTIFGNCTSSDCGAGITLEGFDQTLQSYSKGFVPAQDPQIYGLLGLGANTMQQVGTMTGGLTKQINCVAAAAYPFVPGPKPEDVEDLMGLGRDATEKATDAAADATEAAADKLKNAARVGPSRLKRIAKLEQRAKGLSTVSKGLSLLGYGLAARDSIQNFKNCEAQR